MPLNPSADVVFADGPMAAPHHPYKPDVRRIFKQLEQAMDAFSSGAGSIAKGSKAQLTADLAHDADVTAWVYNDPAGSNNGIYRKSGAFGAGSWTRILDLPFSFIIAADIGVGTSNAMQVTSSIPVSSSALVVTNVFESNTGSPVTIQFNGGPVLTIKTNSGQDVLAGGLVAGMLISGYVSGSTFRLVSDQASAAILAAAEQALAQYEAIRDLAESALQPAQNLNDLADKAGARLNVSVPVYVANRTALKALNTTKDVLVSLQEAGREGFFVWRSGDYSRLVAADASEDVYIKASSIASTAGAWVRQGSANDGVARRYGGGNIDCFGRNSDYTGSGLVGGIGVGGGDPTQPDYSAIKNDGHPNWNALQPSRFHDPIEWNLYASDAQGIAQSQTGTNRIVVQAGSNLPEANWVGRKFYFFRKAFKVASIVNSTTISVTETNGAAVNFPSALSDTFHFVETDGNGLCSISGNVVTYISGTPFVPFITGTDFELTVNGSVVTVSSYTAPVNGGAFAKYTLSTSPGDTASTTFSYRLNINDQLSTIRLQKLRGAGREENLSLWASALGAYHIRALGSGAGQFYPIQIGFDVETPALDVRRTSLNNSNVGVNLLAPIAALHVNGIVQYGNSVTASQNWHWESGTSIYLRLFSGNSGSGTQRFLFENSGAAYSTTGTWGTISDERKKKHIDAARDYTDDLMLLMVKRYAMKDEKTDVPTMLGLIAQDVEAVFPGLVTQDEEGTKMVKTSVLPFMMLTMLQGHERRISALEGAKR